MNNIVARCLARLFGESRTLAGPDHSWSLEANVLRFNSGHDGTAPVELFQSSTHISIAEGTRIGRGTRIHLLGGSLRIEKGVNVGESVDFRPASTISIGSRTEIEDYAQLQSDNAGGLALGDGTHIGRFTRLWAHNGPVVVGDATSIGPSCTFIGTGRGIAIAPRCDFTHDVTLDSAGGLIEMATGSGVGPNSVLYGHGGLYIGSGVAIAGLTMIVPGNHRFDVCDHPIRAQGVDAIPIVIADDVWIGGGAVILGGARIGTGVVVGAGAVVRGEVEPLSVVAGVPARGIAKRGAS